MRIGVVGCAGRMGRMLLRAIAAREGAVIAGGTERPGSAALGADLGVLAGGDPLGLTVGDDAAALFAAADAVIDFTAPAAAPLHADLAVAHGTALIVGTTGLDDGQMAALRRAGGSVPVVWSANYSPGVTLLLGLVRQVAERLDAADWDIDIVEMHHRHKVDAPSGTALALGRAAAAGRGVDLSAVKQAVRDGHTGARPAGEIGFATLRGGDVVGDHTVIFATPGERLELTHKAADRSIFATGAVRAALWTAGRGPGFYGMADVVGM
ncbi:MAG: hypothetical protein RLY86_2385 [Pseudomonadota bacterium]|jgi:4-hydroxy-tetrahydrodipicolinate reductase